MIMLISNHDSALDPKLFQNFTQETLEQIYCMSFSSRYLEDDGWNECLKQETIFGCAKHVNSLRAGRSHKT